MIRKSSKPKAIWTKSAPEQHKRLFPERTRAGGAKARSASEERRMEVYRPIAEMFKDQYPRCQSCLKISHWMSPHTPTSDFEHRTSEIHHKSGRAGLLLFDIRDWVAVCRFCHIWIHKNPAEATKLGLMLKR